VRIGGLDRRDGNSSLSMEKGWTGDSKEIRSPTGKSRTKTDVIKVALQNLIQREKIKDIKTYYGKINLDIDLDTMRSR
jgi:hypothetical protein